MGSSPRRRMHEIAQARQNRRTLPDPRHHLADRVRRSEALQLQLLLARQPPAELHVRRHHHDLWGLPRRNPLPACGLTLSADPAWLSHAGRRANRPESVASPDPAWTIRLARPRAHAARRAHQTRGEWRTPDLA